MRLKQRSRKRPKRPSFCGSCDSGSRRAHIIGVTVSDTASETAIASDSVSANSRNSRPTMPPISRIGRNTATSEMLIDNTVKPTSRAPSNAACMRDLPFSICREMFSSTTIASSTTKPVATISAISDRLSIEKPSRYIAPNVPMIEIGTATLGISVARQLRRNRNTTITTRLTAISSVCSVSFSDARIVVERSSTGVTVMSAGSDAVSCGSAARTRSIVSMMFAPGER